MISQPEYRWIRGHVEVYQCGKFVVSADNMGEAIKEFNLMN
jgi:hypothetical protein